MEADGSRGADGVGDVFEELFAVENDGDGAVEHLEVEATPLVSFAHAFNFQMFDYTTGRKGVGGVCNVDFIAIFGCVFDSSFCIEEDAAIGSKGGFEFEFQFVVFILFNCG